MLPTSSSSCCSSSKAATDNEAEKGKTSHQHQHVVAVAAVDVCLAAACLAGAALLTWWALAFHPTYAQLWMVPVGLVLACTPVVVCAALHFSPAAADTLSPPGKLFKGCGAPPPLSAVVVVHN